MKVIPNVHKFYILLGSLNYYIITDQNELTLIDTGFPHSAKKILRAIRRLGYSPTDLKNILITHADVDHIGGLSTLKKATDAKVYASPIAAEKNNLIDVALEEYQTLPVMSGLRVIPTPGHTACHYSYYLEKEGLLFSGDSLRTLTGRATIWNFKFLIWDKDEMRGSMQRQYDLKPNIICPGHGPTLRNAGKKFLCM